jgi:hypothetical protein
MASTILELAASMPISSARSASNALAERCRLAPRHERLAARRSVGGHDARHTGPFAGARRGGRGRRVPSLAKRLGRTAPALRRTFTQCLALVAEKRRTPAARAAQGAGDVTGVSDGNSIGFNGEIPAGDITIFVEFRTGVASDRIEGEDCPTGAGRLEGRKRSQTTISIRFVGPGRRLLSGYSATLAEENTYRGQTADDAKIDTLTIDHEGIVRTTFTGAGQAPLSLRMVTSRRAQVNMPTSGATSSASAGSSRRGWNRRSTAARGRTGSTGARTSSTSRARRRTPPDRRRPSGSS